MSFPVKLTFEYKLPDELDDETVKQITRHIYKSNDMWIFHEYLGFSPGEKPIGSGQGQNLNLGVEKYVHLSHPDYLWIWTDRKNTNIFGITKNFEVIEISNDLKEFDEILSSNKIESSRQSYNHLINLISHNELFANRFRNALTVSGCVCWCSLHKEEMYELSVETTSKIFLEKLKRIWNDDRILNEVMSFENVCNLFIIRDNATLEFHENTPITYPPENVGLVKQLTGEDSIYAKDIDYSVRKDIKSISSDQDQEIPLMEINLGDEPFNTRDVEIKLYKLKDLITRFYKEPQLVRGDYTMALFCIHVAFKIKESIKNGDLIIEKTESYNTIEGKKFYESLPDKLNRKFSRFEDYPYVKFISKIDDLVKGLLKIKNDTVKINLYYLLQENLLI